MSAAEAVSPQARAALAAGAPTDQAATDRLTATLNVLCNFVADHRYLPGPVYVAQVSENYADLYVSSRLTPDQALSVVAGWAELLGVDLVRTVLPGHNQFSASVDVGGTGVTVTLRAVVPSFVGEVTVAEALGGDPA